MVINISVPLDWSDLSQKNLRCLLRCICSLSKSITVAIDDFGWAKVFTDFILRYNGIKVIGRFDDFYLFRKEGTDFQCPADVWAQSCLLMNWAKEIPESPVRLECVQKHCPICDIQLQNLSLENYLALENYWQSFNAYTAPEALICMTEILYGCEGISPSSEELMSVTVWWASVKKLLSFTFPNFLRPAAQGSEEFSSLELRRNTDAIIRALTKGDVTKRESVLKIPLWEALAELDALAREYDEINKKYPNT